MKTYLPFAIIASCLLACSPSRAHSSLGAYGVSASDDAIEVAATPEQQAKEEVLATPIDFVVPLEQDRFAWERARLFLESYASGDGSQVNAVVLVVGSRRGLSGPPGVSRYTYEVLKEFSGDGYRYSVRCAPSADGRSDHAALNAANFARFVRDGKLEVSLLAR